MKEIDELKQFQRGFNQAIKRRNLKIAQLAIEGIGYLDIAKIFEISRKRVMDILKRQGVSVPCRKGLPKYDLWKKRISETMLKNSNKKK